MSIETYPLVRDWLVASPGRLILRTGKVDLGQRISTALIRVASEELSLPLHYIEVAPVRTCESPDEGITSGSNSIEQSGHAQRLACATARNQALALAADRFGTKANALDLIDGKIIYRGTNSGLDVLDLLAELPEDLAIDQEPQPRALAVPIPDVPPVGLRAMVEGRFSYIHDLERDGMLHARIVRPPTLHSKLATLNPAVVERLQDAGLHILRDGAFLAVAGADEWQVKRASDAVGRACDWDIGDGLETGDIFDILKARTPQSLAVVNGVPVPDAAVPDPIAEPDYREAFERPYTLHGALAPSAALALFENDRLSVLTHSQGIFFLRDSIADSLGLDPEQVTLEHVAGSGCYGHNGADDAAFEAALVARMLPGQPVLLKYSREDEHGREPAGTAMRVEIAAKTDAGGRIGAVWMEARGDTHRGRPRAGADRAGPARLAANAARVCDVPRFVPEPNLNRHAGLHRNLDPIYDFPQKSLVKALVPDLPLRPSALRCLGAPANILAIESMMDELADAKGADPIDFRMHHLDDDRAKRVLRRLKTRLTSVGAPRSGAGRGIAYAQYKNSMTRVAVAVDLVVDDRGGIGLDDVWMVADAGRVIDPDGLRAQLEGGCLQGASWALHEHVTWRRSGRERLDWDSYPVIRFDNVPRIHIELTSSREEKALGAGEASPAPTVAAIANALFQATGLRLRRMPFDSDAIMSAALNA